MAHVDPHPTMRCSPPHGPSQRAALLGVLIFNDHHVSLLEFVQDRLPRRVLGGPRAFARELFVRFNGRGSLIDGHAILQILA